MSSLRYAILGLLMDKPATGYDISKLLYNDADSYWRAGHSQIYPELKALTREGLIRFDTVIHGERLEKKRYEITPEGRADFLAWLALDEEALLSAPDVFRLRTHFSHHLSAHAFLQLLHSQMLQRRRSLDEMTRRREALCPPEQAANLTGEQRSEYLVLQRSIRMTQAQLEWLQECRELVLTWEETPSGPS